MTPMVQSEEKVKHSSIEIGSKSPPKMKYGLNSATSALPQAKK